MSKANSAHLFNCYIWLVDTIFSRGPISRGDIDSIWSRNSSLNDNHDVQIAESTFHRWRKAAEEMFLIEIKCNANGEYYIDNDQKENDIRTWLINSLSTKNIIENCHQLESRILFENIPSGQRFLTPIVEAMRDGVQLEVTYQSYTNSAPSTFRIAPYCVKLFKQRWYVLAKSQSRNEPRIYSLDRIHSISTTEVKFNCPVNFDAERYFARYYGIMCVDGKAEFVRVKVSAKQANYLRSLPLHLSQKEISSDEESAIFEFFVVPTQDFIMELRTHGPELEVLEPISLRRQFKEDAKKLQKNYK